MQNEYESTSRRYEPRLHCSQRKIGSRSFGLNLQKKEKNITKQIRALETIQWDDPGSLKNREILQILKSTFDLPEEIKITDLEAKLKPGTSPQEIKVLKKAVKEAVKHLKSDKEQLHTEPEGAEVSKKRPRDEAVETSGSKKKTRNFRV